MQRVMIIDRKGSACSFLGANLYALKPIWPFVVIVYADGLPVGYFWRPLSVAIGMPSPDEIRSVADKSEEYRAAIMGVKLD